MGSWTPCFQGGRRPVQTFSGDGALLYLLVVPLLAGVGFVVWLGWGWPALVLTVVTALLVAGALFVLSFKRYRRVTASDPEWR